MALISDMVCVLFHSFKYLEAMLFAIVSVSLLADHAVDPLCDRTAELFMLSYL